MKTFLDFLEDLTFRNEGVLQLSAPYVFLGFCQHERMSSSMGKSGR